MPTPLVALDFVCPVCGAEPRQTCKLIGGGLRFESHAERKYIARDHQLGRALPKAPRTKKLPQK
jgi:hypothetical protein